MDSYRFPGYEKGLDLTYEERTGIRHFLFLLSHGVTNRSTVVSPTREEW